MKCAIFRYFGYILLSFIVGLLSFIADEDSDFLYKLSGNLLALLITLTTLYTTLTNLIVAQLAKMKDKHDVDITSCIGSLRRNIKIMFVIIAVDFLAFELLNIKIPDIHELVSIISTYSRLIVDMMTFFSLFYFLYVVYDTTMAFYNLFEANHGAHK